MANGELSVSTNGKFLHFNIGHMVIIMGMVGSLIVWFMTYDRSINETKIKVQSLIEQQATLTLDVRAMDTSGTRYSQRNIDRELDALKLEGDRLTKLEQVNIDLLPKFERMTFQVQGISQWVEEQKKRQQHP